MKSISTARTRSCDKRSDTLRSLLVRPLHQSPFLLLALCLFLSLMLFGLVACTEKTDAGESVTTSGEESVDPSPETQPADTQPVDTQPMETQPMETQPMETQPVDTQPADTTPQETDPQNPPIREDSPMRENITLNAYLIPMMTDELRNEMLQLCKDADIDILSHVYVNRPWVATDHTFEWYKQAMADADRYGLRLLTRDYNVQNAVNRSDEQIRALAEAYKDLPGFGGFFIVDEPYNPTPFARVENAFRTVCPDAYINVNFLPCASYPSQDIYLRQLCDYGGLLTYGGTLSLDAYCFPVGGGVDERSLFSNYDTLRQAGLITHTDTAVYVQSVGMAGHYRRPSGADLRYNMMAALAYGIKEIKFFTWGAPTADEGNYTDAILDHDNKPTDLYYEVCKINKKIHALGTHLVACDAKYVYHTRMKTAGAYEVVPSELFVQAEGADVILSLMEEREGNGEYLFVVNKDITDEQTVTLTFADMTRVWLVSDTTGELTEAVLRNGTLTLTLAAGDCALIRLPEGDFIHTPSEDGQNLALHAPVTGTSSVGSEDYYLYNLTDGVVHRANAARVNTAQGEFQLLTVDLGAVRTINRIDIYPAGVGPLCGLYNPSAFTLLVSSDGKSWETVASSSQPLSREFVSVFRFTDTEARYVRIRLAGSQGAVGFVDIGELMVYMDDGSIEDSIPTSYTKEDLTEGQNLALNKPVVEYSSTTDVPEWTCHHSYLTDGDYTHAWASELYRNENPDSPEWITIDLTEVYDINCVKLVPRGIWNGVNVFPEDYEIQVSIDGVHFVTVCSVKGDNIPQTQDDRILNFDAVPARFVRLYATRLTASSTVNGGYCIEICEMEVFGQVHDPALLFPEDD